MAAFASRSYVWMHLLSDDHLLQDGRSGSGKKKFVPVRTVDVEYNTDNILF